jgi:hypothetical protein
MTCGMNQGLWTYIDECSVSDVKKNMSIYLPLIYVFAVEF